MDISWSGNWDDNLGGSQETAGGDPILATMSEHVKMEFEETFMFYLPRICEHCLNPSCVAACPSGAMYKREEDGIVLVDEDACRGWRMCVSACPYKKVYFNHKTGKAEKCTLCYPLIEQGKPTICSETCVGRLRYLGLMLYDADKVLEAASIENDHDLLDAQRSVFLDPFDPEVIAAAKAEGMADDWIEAAQNSPIYKLISEYKLALPLHPEYRTMPMVWYIPPLSPVVDVITNTGNDGEDSRNLFAAIDKLRIPVEYLAGLFSAGDVKPVESSLRKLAAMRSYMRDINLGQEPDEGIPGAVGMTGGEIQAMYRLLAIAKYEDRYVIPKAHVETARDLEQLGCSLDTDGGPGMGGPGSNAAGPYAKTPGMPLNSTVDNYNAMRGEATRGESTGPTTPGRVNLLNWNGDGAPPGMFPPVADPGSAA